MMGRDAVPTAADTAEAGYLAGYLARSHRSKPPSLSSSKEACRGPL